MRAALFHEHGDPAVIRIEDVPVPEPGPGAVRIAVRAAALNHLDLWVRRGLPIETTMPHIGGSDIAGVVDHTGPGVDGVAIGTPVVVNPSLWCGTCPWCQRGEQPLCASFRIIGEHTQGGFAQFVTAPARNLFRIPDDYPFARAAAAPLAFLTAWRGLINRGRLRAGERVLVTGASGGVASAALQIARRAGAHVYAVTTTEHLERARTLGADTVYDRNRVDVARAVWEDTARQGVDLIFDSVGAAMFAGNVRALARGGRLVSYGATTGASAPLELTRLFWKQLEVLGTTMASVAEFEAVMTLVFAGELEPVVDVVWPLERARDAHLRLEAGAQFGKIVLTP